MDDIIDYFKMIYTEDNVPTGLSETYNRIISAPGNPEPNLDVYDDIFKILYSDKEVGTKLNQLISDDKNDFKNDFMLELFKAEGYLQGNTLYEDNKQKRENVFKYSIDIETINIPGWDFVECPRVRDMLDKKSKICEKNGKMDIAIKAREKLIEIYELCNDATKRDYELAYQHIGAYRLYKKNNDIPHARDHIKKAHKLAEGLQTGHMPDYEKECLLINVYSSLSSLTKESKDQKENKWYLMAVISNGNKLIDDEKFLALYKDEPPKIYINAIKSYKFAIKSYKLALSSDHDVDDITYKDIKSQLKTVEEKLRRNFGL